MGSAVSDRALVLTLVIAFSQKEKQIRDRSGLPWERVKSTLSHLTHLDVVRSVDGGHYAARQDECALCPRPGSAMEGERVYIDPESLRWFCQDCWDMEVTQVRALVEGA